jgi:hypothetical protein
MKKFIAHPILLLFLIVLAIIGYKYGFINPYLTLDDYVNKNL